MYKAAHVSHASEPAMGAVQHVSSSFVLPSGCIEPMSHTLPLVHAGPSLLTHAAGAAWVAGAHASALAASGRPVPDELSGVVDDASRGPGEEPPSGDELASVDEVAPESPVGGA